jgi:hypothetical protein
VSHPNHHPDDEFIPETLLALLLLCAFLLLLVMGPAKSPPLDKLTEFSCDTPPIVPESRVGRGTAGMFYYTCHSDHQAVHMRGLPLYTNSQKWRDCRRAQGLVKIWRPAFPSPYGANIFQINCNGAVIVSYEDAAAVYEARRAFVAIVAWTLLAVSALALVLRGIHLVKRKQRDRLIEG